MGNLLLFFSLRVVFLLVNFIVLEVVVAVDDDVFVGQALGFFALTQLWKPVFVNRKTRTMVIKVWSKDADEKPNYCKQTPEDTSNLMIYFVIK